MTKKVKTMIKALKAHQMIFAVLIKKIGPLATPYNGIAWNPYEVKHWVEVIDRIKRDWPETSLVARFAANDIEQIRQSAESGIAKIENA